MMRGVVNEYKVGRKVLAVGRRILLSSLEFRQVGIRLKFAEVDDFNLNINPTQPCSSWSSSSPQT